MWHLLKLAVYMGSPQTSIPALCATLARFSDMSGQRVNVDKSIVLLLGRDRQDAENAEDGSDADPAMWWPGMPFTTLDLCVEKYHGIQLTSRTKCRSSMRSTK